MLVLGGAVFGGYDLVKLLDRSPELTFSPEGFVDHRVARPMVIPLGKIRLTRLSRRRAIDGLDAGAFPRRWRARAGAGEPSGGDAEGAGAASAGICATGRGG